MLLPADKARHVGEAVAMVVAETKNQAMDAAEAVEVDYEELPFVIHSEDAIKPGAPAVWDELPSNMPVETFFGDRAATDKAFAQADHVVKLDMHIGRVTGVPIELRAANANYDKASGRYTLYAGSGGAVRQKNELTQVLGIKPDDLRVLSYDVGGNFGTRNRVFVEFGLVLWASKKVGRPVKYTATRSEAFLSDYQGRDLVTKVELALRKDGKFLAMRATNISNIGARAVSFSPLSKGSGLIPGSYDIPAVTLRAVATFTNTMPTQAYRSSGRPEVTYAIERLIDNAAAELGFDRVSLRRKNLIKPKALPYRNAVGMLYDSGDYEKNMNWAMDIADWKGFSQRKREAKKRGKLLGLGLCNYVESSIGAPKEQAQIYVRPEGRVDVVIGTQPSGQGHETSFAQVVSDLIHVPVEKVKIILGDTDVVKVGGGSHSGRSMRHAATVFSKAAVDLIDKGKKIAALAMNVPPDTIEFTDDGRFMSRGTNRSFDFLELAKEAANLTLPDDLKGGVSIVTDNEMHDPVFPNGTAICEVEVDPDTGLVDHRALCLDRRRRPLHQSADRARPDPRRHRAGRRPGDVGAVLHRSGFRPAVLRLADGLRHAARRRRAVVHLRDRRGAVADQSARHQGRRRGRHDRRAGGGGVSDRRCALGVRHPQHHDAGDAVQDLEGDPGREGAGLRSSPLPLRLDLVEPGLRALELFVEEPHRGEDLAVVHRGSGPVGPAEGEHAVVAQVAHDLRIGDSIAGQVTRPERRPRRARNDLDELEDFHLIDRVRKRFQDRRYLQEDLGMGVHQAVAHRGPVIEALIVVANPRLLLVVAGADRGIERADLRP